MYMDMLGTESTEFEMGMNYALAKVRKEPLLWCYVADFDHKNYGLEIERPTLNKAINTAYKQFRKWYAENGDSFTSCITFYRYYNHPSGRMAVVKKVDTVLELDK